MVVTRKKPRQGVVKPQVETLEDRCLLSCGEWLTTIDPCPATHQAMGRFKLGEGQRAFWAGPYVQQANVPDAALCGAAGPCWEWKLELKEPGWRLRVAIDVVLHGFRQFPDPATDPGATYRWQVFKPDGTFAIHSDGFSADRVDVLEYLVDAPEAGAWTVRVIPVDVRDRSFRMRAKLEAEPEPSDELRLLRPNLRIAPPFELSFVTPTVTFGPGAPTFDARTSCLADERINSEDGDPPTGACLRFSAGVENVGKGPLLIDRADTPDADSGTFPATQYLVDSTWPWAWNGRQEQVGEVGSAGEFHLHPTHGHFHYQGIYTYQLWQVADVQAGTLEQIGHGHKLGFMPGNEFMADWHRFIQNRQFTTPGNAEAKIGTGWMDIYEWNRAGQYVDFPMQPEGTPVSGYYIVRGIADSENRLVESNERDNVSYAYIRVEGETVCLLERGYGESPWDPHSEPIESPTPFTPCAGPDAPTSGESSTSANERIFIDFVFTGDLLDETEKSALLIVPEELTTEPEASGNLGTTNVDALFSAVVDESDPALTDSDSDTTAPAGIALGTELGDPLGV